MTDILEGLLPKSATIPDGPVMDFKVHREDLIQGLHRVESVVPSKDLVPVLKNLHFKVTPTDLQITASDSILSVITHVPVISVATSGQAVFPAARTVALVQGANYQSKFALKVTSKNERMSAVIKSDATTWKIPLMSPAGYPDFSATEDFGLVSVPRLAFLHALQSVRKAASTDSMRPFLMLVDVTHGKMRASDSIRFQQIKFDFPFDCQIPVRAAHELAQRLSSSKLDEIEVGQTESALLFRFGPALLIAQKVAAKFPDVDEVMLKPTLENDQELVVNREDLIAAVRRARVTADENTYAVVLSLNIGSISVESKDRRGGTTVETVPATWNYPPRHVSFNYQHLSDMLGSIKSEECVLRLGKDLKTRPSPLLMEDEGSGFTAVLSQIRLDWM